MQDFSQMKEQVDHYKANGGDINLLLHHVQAIASTGKTPIGLNKWIKSDKPTMEDFNNDNDRIDECIRDFSQAKRIKQKLIGFRKLRRTKLM